MTLGLVGAVALHGRWHPQVPVETLKTWCLGSEESVTSSTLLKGEGHLDPEHPVR